MKAVAISRWALLVFLGIVLTACGASKPKPAQIPAIKADKPIQALWQFKLGGDVSFVQSLQSVQERMALDFRRWQDCRGQHPQWSACMAP
jgi:hypothetical protein